MVKILSLVILPLFHFGLKAESLRQTSTKVASTAEIIENLTLREKVGQLFVFDFSGTNMNRYLKYKLKKLRPGGLITFRRNIQTPLQIAQLNHSIQKSSLRYTNLPMLIMVDQEGGQVTRIRTKPSPPSALSIGLTQNPEIAKKSGLIIGRMLSLLGFNINSAPVVDISNPLKKNFIGNRSFGSDPMVVQKMGVQFSKGLLETGIIPTFKHFPGHGGDISDSHKLLPQKMSKLTDLEKLDLKPYQFLSNTNYKSAIMTAHISFPKIDPDRTPATFSKKLITGVLKEKYGYKGIIITDDISMKGAHNIGSPGNRAIKALQAGCDMIMFTSNYHKQKAIINTVIRAVKKGLISEERINESLKKIVRYKKSLMKKNYIQFPTKKKVAQGIKSYIAGINKLADSVAQSNFNKDLKKNIRIYDVIDSQSALLVFSADRQFYKYLKHRSKTSMKFVRITKGSRKKIAPILNNYKDSFGIYYVTGIITARIVSALSNAAKRKLVVINTTHPGSIRGKDKFLAVLNLNTTNYKSGYWLKQAIKDYENERFPATN